MTHRTTWIALRINSVSIVLISLRFRSSQLGLINKTGLTATKKGNKIMFDFRKTALESTLLSKLQNDREKISTHDLIQRFPDGITVNAFDFATVDGKAYAVVTFNEDDSLYYNGGTVLSKMCTAWAAGFAGDPEAASTALTKAGGVKLKFAEEKTKGGNNVTTITVV